MILNILYPGCHEYSRVIPAMSLTPQSQTPRSMRHFISWPFSCLKYSSWAPYEQAKTVSRTFSFLRRYSRKSCVCVVVDYADTRFSNFAIEYLRENEICRKTVFACSYEPLDESFKQQKWSKISWHCPCKGLIRFIQNIWRNIAEYTCILVNAKIMF